MRDDNGNVKLNGISGTVYTLSTGTNAMCRLEAISGRAYHETLRELQSGEPRMETARQLLQAVLIDPAAPSADVAGDVLDDIGGIALLMLAVAPVVPVAG